jgi:hypothetical protein
MFQPILEKQKNRRLSSSPSTPRQSLIPQVFDWMEFLIVTDSCKIQFAIPVRRNNKDPQLLESAWPQDTISHLDGDHSNLPPLLVEPIYCHKRLYSITHPKKNKYFFIDLHSISKSSKSFSHKCGYRFTTLLGW